MQFDSSSSILLFFKNWGIAVTFLEMQPWETKRLDKPSCWPSPAPLIYQAYLGHAICLEAVSNDKLLAATEYCHFPLPRKSLHFCQFPTIVWMNLSLSADPLWHAVCIHWHSQNLACHASWYISSSFCSGMHEGESYAQQWIHAFSRPCLLWPAWFH